MRTSRFLLVLLLLVLTGSCLVLNTVPADSAPAKAGTAKSIPTQLQDSSVTIHTPTGEGSGFLKTRGEQTFVWTAGHVISDLRKARTVVDGKGLTRTIVEFDDASVFTLKIQAGRIVRKSENYAKVVKYSDADHGEDLALLQVREKGWTRVGTQFYLDREPPELGADLWHCGSLFGQFGANSLVKGNMAQHGRLIDGKVFDQCNINSQPGSSGGGVYLKTDARCIGMLVRGAQGGLSLIVPVRRMRDWAREAKVEWALDDTVPMPRDEELAKLPVED